MLFIDCKWYTSRCIESGYRYDDKSIGTRIGPKNTGQCY